QLANRILRYFDGLELLQNATLDEMVRMKGIGQAKAVHLIAAIELGKRMAQVKTGVKYAIRSPEDGANYVMEEMRTLLQEHFVCLYLNTKNQVLHKQTIFIGSLNSSIVHP
ncbi:hypothetical protein KZ294_25435, partial [Escherichia coli]|nr:hypothetical protein [Escherichia coli]